MVNSLRENWLCVAIVIVTTYSVVSLAGGQAVVIEDARHLKVFYEEGRFAGWPANNGIWQWGDEILVGFSLGYLAPREQRGLHQIDPARPRSIMLARSLDGGETWSASEAGYPDGQLQQFPTDIAFDAPGFALNTRGDRAFISLDKGRTWNGPYRLPFADLNLRARTDYQVLGPRDLALFLTAQKTNDREGRPFCARTRTGGRRRRDNDPAQHNFIELFRSRDGGLSWQCLANPVKENGLHSGNPPSMVRLTDGRLCITYANRDEPHSIRAVLSSDNDTTWGREHVLRRNGGEPDIGYTRTVQRPDGKLVTIYYWLDKPRTERYIAATIWSPPKVEKKKKMTVGFRGFHGG